MKALEPSSCAPVAARPDDGLALRAEAIGEAVDERLLRSDDEEVGVEPPWPACRRR
jgi:hypothetical protein